MKLRWLLPGASLLLSGCVATARSETPRPEEAAPVLLTRPAPGTDLEAFERGRQLFTREFTAQGGILGLQDGLQYAEHHAFDPPPQGELGRDYNGVSCVSCHDVGGPGGQGDASHGSFLDTYRFNTESGEYPLSPRAALPLDPLGLFPGQEIRYSLARSQPITYATDIAPLVPPSLFGLGQLDQVSDEYIESHCGVEPALGIAGTPMRGDGQRIMRFGRRGQANHLDSFVSAAFILEMGVTDARSNMIHLPPEPPELSDQEVKDVVSFVAGLAPPPALPTDIEGRQAFEKFGCAVCHDLTRQGTDQCAHDMGGQLIDDFNPTPFVPSVFSWRTGRLVGVRYLTSFLHDGRARSVEDAVAAHGGGESRKAKERFDAGTAAEREALFRFLRTL